jgi:FtsP/CotA-like multicopper oxidase with cupredoxin domain
MPQRPQASLEGPRCRMNRSRKLLAICVVTVVLIVSLTFLAVAGPLNSISQTPGTVLPPTISKSTCDRPPNFILIIADLSGFNNSIGHGAPANPWPIIRVHRGDVVRLLVCNEDPTQPHGFAIVTYLDAGIPLAPGDAYRIVFTANVPGSFVIYCNIFCTIHRFMVGRLIVSD